MSVKMELWTDKLKTLLLGEIPILSAVTYYEVNNEGRRIESPIGSPEFKQWDKTIEIPSRLVEDEPIRALDLARQQLAVSIAQEIQADLLTPYPARLNTQDRLPADVRKEPHHYVYVVSPGRFAQLQAQDKYYFGDSPFDNRYFGGSPFDNRYFYEGVETLRHYATPNIIVKIKESGVWNLRTSLSTRYIVERDTYELTAKTSGYFLIRMSAL